MKVLQKRNNRNDLSKLAIRMKRGDRIAAAALYDDLSPKVYGFLVSRLADKEAAEDLCQNIFIRLIEKIDTFNPKKGNFTIWFWQMVRNVQIDWYRKKKDIPFSRFDEDTVETFAVQGMEDIDQRLQCDKLRQFLGTLVSHERELFELRYVAGMPYRDIAQLMARTEGSLRVTALRVKQKIRNEFQYLS